MSNLRKFLRDQHELILQCGGLPTVDGGKTSIPGWILDHGMDFTYQPLPSDYRYGEVKHCFMNSFNLMMSNPDLIYCEGYGSGIIPVHHAWCITRDGEVIDSTWRPDMVCDGTFLGVPMDREFVYESVMCNGWYGILDNWEGRWPVLTGEIPLEEVLCRDIQRPC